MKNVKETSITLLVLGVILIVFAFITYKDISDVRSSWVKVDAEVSNIVKRTSKHNNIKRTVKDVYVTVEYNGKEYSNIKASTGIFWASEDDVLSLYFNPKTLKVRNVVKDTVETSGVFVIGALLIIVSPIIYMKEKRILS